MEVTSPQDFFLERGIMGVIIVVLAGVIVFLWFKLEQVRKDADQNLKEKDKEIDALNAAMQVVLEKRVGDYREVINGFNLVGNSMAAALASVQKSVDGFAQVLNLRNRE